MSARPVDLAVTRAFAVLLRDVLTFVGGWALMLSQAGVFFPPPEQFQVWVLIIGAMTAGVPGIAQVISWRAGGTGGSVSPPPEPAPPTPSPSSSST